MTNTKHLFLVFSNFKKNRFQITKSNRIARINQYRPCIESSTMYRDTYRIAVKMYRYTPNMNVLHAIAYITWDSCQIRQHTRVGNHCKTPHIFTASCPALPFKLIIIKLDWIYTVPYFSFKMLFHFPSHVHEDPYRAER